MTRVIDGDTIEVNAGDGRKDKIRLLGIDTPEIGGSNKPNEYGAITDTACLDDWGIRAKKFAADTLEGRMITLEIDGTTFEELFTFGRLLAFVNLDGDDFNRMLLELGLARAYTEAGHSREREYLDLDRQAQANSTGLWACKDGVATPTPTVASLPTPTSLQPNTPTPSPIATPTSALQPTAIPTPDSTPSPTMTTTQTATPQPTITPAVAPTPTHSPTAVSTPVPTPTPTPNPTPTSAPQPTVTQTPVPTLISTPTTAPTPTPLPTATPVPTVTPTPTPLPPPTPLPTATPAPTATPVPTATPTGTGCSAGQVDVNLASAEDLDLITHIGPARAADMIAKRPFSSLDDLERIDGIGPSRLADIKAQGVACIGN